MGLLDPWKAYSEAAALRADVEALRLTLKAIQEEGARALAREVAELDARIGRESLAWAELYDKTHHYLKRIEQRHRADEPIPENGPTEPVDVITARIMARRGRRV